MGKITHIFMLTTDHSEKNKTHSLIFLLPASPGVSYKPSLRLVSSRYKFYHSSTGQQTKEDKLFQPETTWNLKRTTEILAYWKN